MTKVKICGLSTPESITATCEAGADFIGFVFYAPSPRYVTPEMAQYLGSYIPNHIKKVGLFVEPDDVFLKTILQNVPLDFLQIHSDETPERLHEIKKKFGLPIIKSFSIEDTDDLANVSHYEGIADWFLFDAKPDALPGGNGEAFDWSILENFKSQTPWMLAGGLTHYNVADAVQKLAPPAVDVSSGVESEKGVKDDAKIHSFIQAVKQA